MRTMASEITSLTIVYSTVYSGTVTDQRKHQSSASLANSLHKRPVTWKCFHLMTSSSNRCITVSLHKCQGVSNLRSLFNPTIKKHQRSALLELCAGMVDSLHKGPVMLNTSACNDVTIDLFIHRVSKVERNLMRCPPHEWPYWLWYAIGQHVKITSCAFIMALYGIYVATPITQSDSTLRETSTEKILPMRNEDWTVTLKKTWAVMMPTNFVFNVVKCRLSWILVPMGEWGISTRSSPWQTTEIVMKEVTW